MKPQGFLAQATYRITAAALQSQNIVRSELQAKLIKFQINLVLKLMLGFPKIDKALYPKSFAFHLQYLL